MRKLLGIAGPTLLVLAAEPIYLLIDTAVVGRLGVRELAALAIGALVLTQVSVQLTFLSYGTTSRAARAYGAGDVKGAVAEGVSASWLALGIGLGIVAVTQVFAEPIAGVLASDAAVAAEAVTWLRVALCGVPLILLTMAGNGWMRGVQDVRRPVIFTLAGVAVSTIGCLILVPPMGLVGSAVANLAGQGLAAMLFADALRRRAAGNYRPRRARVAAQLRLGRDLVLRSLAFQVCFVSAAFVAARSGAAALAAHQIALGVWNLVGLVIDSLAVAAQTMVGAALGAGHIAAARALAWQVMRWMVVIALVIAAVLAAAAGPIGRVFSTDAGVLAQLPGAWWPLVVALPIAAVAFALDGALLGAGDAAFLRNATIGSAVLGFLPAIWLSLALNWGLRGIWCGLALFVLLRALAVTMRARGGTWSAVLES